MYGKERTKKSSIQIKKKITLDETFNKQNDIVYSRSPKEALELVPRLDSVSLMIWWGVSYDCITSLHCEKGVKRAARNYLRKILTIVVEHINLTIFQNRQRIFQQYSAPALKAKTTQKWH